VPDTIQEGHKMVVCVVVDREVCACKKHDGEVVVAGYLELKAKDISFSG